MRSFSAEAVATIALWKSAPIGSLVSVPPAPRFHVSLHWTSADRDFFQVPLLRDDHRGANFSPLNHPSAALALITLAYFTTYPHWPGSFLTPGHFKPDRLSLHFKVWQTG